MANAKSRYRIKNADGSYSIRWFETLGDLVIFDDNTTAEEKKGLWDSYGTILTLSHTKSGTTHSLAFSVQNVPTSPASPYLFCQFKATAGFTAGDTVQFTNSSQAATLTPLLQNGESAPDNVFQSGNFVLCVIDGSASSIIFLTGGGGGSGIGGNVSTADKLSGATADSQASTGKSLSSTVPASSADAVLAVFDIGSISLLGRYSISIRLKGSHRSNLTTNLLKVEFVRTRGSTSAVLKTGYIRESDVYTTSDYCTFAMAVEINDGLQSSDTYAVRFKTVGNTNSVTWKFDYVYASLAGATIFSI